MGKIQEYGVRMFQVDTCHNLSDNVSKVRNVKQYLETDLWNYGPADKIDPE